MIKIKIKYSIEDEIKRIITTIKKIDWFIEQGYDFDKLTFPKSLPIAKIKLVTEEEIKSFVEEEYNIEDFDNNAKYLKSEWLKIGVILSEKIQKIGIKPEDEYFIYFTKYGMGGSYHRPKSVILNITRKWNVGLLRTVIHEIIHLSIEDLIMEYKIKHWAKERIVDLIFADFFPEFSKMQNIPNTEEVDIVFNKYYPNIKKIITEVSRL